MTHSVGGEIHLVGPRQIDATPQHPHFPYKVIWVFKIVEKPPFGKVGGKINDTLRSVGPCEGNGMVWVCLSIGNLVRKRSLPLPLSWERSHLGRYFSGRDACAPRGE